MLKCCSVIYYGRGDYISVQYIYDTCLPDNKTIVLWNNMIRFKCED